MQNGLYKALLITLSEMWKQNILLCEKQFLYGVPLNKTIKLMFLSRIVQVLNALPTNFNELHSW